jgi:NAD(P)H-hydrate epimerase
VSGARLSDGGAAHSRPVVLTREQVRELDRLATELYGIPGAVLMENAGRSAALACVDALRRGGVRLEGARAVILCGPGNNGGDGCVLARHLRNAGASVELFSTVPSESLRGDAAWARVVVERMGIEVATLSDFASLQPLAARLDGAALAVDALLGTGARGAPRGIAADAIRAANGAAGLLRVALDLPSGLDCESGEPAEPCFRADLTVTFAALKPGLLAARARPFVGEVVVGEIGVPRELLERVRGVSPGT